MAKMAFVFPGQGSQAVGMLADLAQEYPTVVSTFAQASDVLGFDLWQLVANGPEVELNKTEHTQPALLAASVAIWRIWQDLYGQTPKFLAGHSLGEYSALVCANALDFQQAVSLVSDRGKFMQRAVPVGHGAMAAIIGLDDDQVLQCCQHVSQLQQVVTPANYNSKGQVVVAGETAAVEKVIELAKEAGAKLAKLIPVSVPSHCPLMQPAAEQLKQKLDLIAIRSPIISVINNVDVAAYQEEELIRDALVRQLINPVRWVETIEFLVDQGVDTIVECGPGKVLTGLNKRIDTNINVFAINDPESMHKAMAFQTERLV